MTVSRFLHELAETLERSTPPPKERARLARLCRDFATVAQFAEDFEPHVFGSQDSLPVAATISVDAA